MPRSSFQVRLERISTLTPGIRELVCAYDPKDSVSFRSGQFMMMHIPHGGGAPVKRAYSIASSHHESKHFKLLIKLIPGGIASDYVAQLRDGQSMEFSGPFGKCFFETPAPREVLFLCTGAGLAQHFSMLASEAPNFPGSRFHLLIGVWNESEIFYQRELDELKKNIPNFHYEFVLDKANKGWTGKTGYVTSYLKDFDLSDAHVYLCGNPEMIKGAKHILTGEMNVPKEKISAEAFNFAPAPVQKTS